VLWTFDSLPDLADHTIDTNSQWSSKITMRAVTNQIVDTAPPSGVAPNPATRWQRQSATAPSLANRPDCGILRSQPCRPYVPWNVN
jgi:hypothetical protein